MMRMKILERLRGEGVISREDGTVVGTRLYNLTIYQEMLDAGGHAIEGMKSIEGAIQLEGYEGWSLLVKGGTLRLRLNDGRTLPFFFSNSDGTIAATGGFLG